MLRTSADSGERPQAFAAQLHRNRSPGSGLGPPQAFEEYDEATRGLDDDDLELEQVREADRARRASARPSLELELPSAELERVQSSVTTADLAARVRAGPWSRRRLVQHRVGGFAFFLPVRGLEVPRAARVDALLARGGAPRERLRGLASGSEALARRELGEVRDVAGMERES